jgi:[ribosomal protein S5]-alanine N-acetyltransferase
MTTHELPPQDERIEIVGQDGFVLRQLIPDDAQRYFDLIDADRGHFKYGEEITPNKYPTAESVRLSIEDGGKSKKRFGIWNGDEMVGSINLQQNRPGTGEVGYWIGSQYKGHGYAKHATELLAGYAFDELGLQRLTAWVASENLPSVKTLEKVGFRRMTNSGPQIFYELTKRGS